MDTRFTMLIVVALLIFVPMVAEAGLAARNERRQFARGGHSPAGDVYEIMRFAYPGVFAAILAEGALRGIPAPSSLFTAGVAVFGAAKIVKWAAMHSLGPSWTFRVIVVPGDRRVTSGPYRFLRHPNYVGVVGEIIGTALMAAAPVTGLLGLLGFGTLMRRRIAVEERALEELQTPELADRLRAK